MQTRKDGEITGFEQGDFRSLAERLETQIEQGEADSGTIAKMPEKGKKIEINGLEFEVQQITKSGNIILEPKGKK